MRALAVVTAIVAMMAGSANADSFTIQFDWGGLKSCNSGNPRVVPNPRFSVSGLPEGTAAVEFKLKDLDAPSYSHGGGKVKMSANGQVPSGAFKYKSPCPPNTVHTYEWTATAKDAKGKKLGVAKAARKYPE